MKNVAVIGGGPAGLMAADALSQSGVQVDLYDAMPSVGRKFLLAGKGGLNLTHSEPTDAFASRFAARRSQVQPLLDVFGAQAVRDWAMALGVETYVGTSGRVFPTDMKAAPLLRAWLHRLRAAGVRFHMRHRWTGWDADNNLQFDTPSGVQQASPDAVILALGGASWKRLGSDGAWVALLEERGVTIAPLKPANCGFDVALAGDGHAGTSGWSDYFASRYAGQPFKSVAINFTDAHGHNFQRKGEFVATATGVEGSLIYAASALLRDEIEASGSAVFHLDLLPDRSAEVVLKEVRYPRGSRSLSSHLKSRLGIEGIKSAILHEVLGKDAMADAAVLAGSIKALPLRLAAARPVDEAISTAGGVPFEAMNANCMLVALPGVFCAGEMLDWEAPTGGYLLTASLASGHAAAVGVLHS
jgi:uncharacterized flavoprotein (TIGR03862 family)